MFSTYEQNDYLEKGFLTGELGIAKSPLSPLATYNRV